MAAESPVEPIDAVPVRHPGRWVAVAVLIAIAAMVVHMLLFNKAFDWPFIFEAMNQNSVIEGFIKGTIVVTVLSMALGVAGGVILAVMRLSDNPILRGASWFYTWFFRAVPRYVLLTIMGALGVVFPDGISFIPYHHTVLGWFGIASDASWMTIDANRLFAGFTGAVLGMAASEAAYMAEIARAGILSVDKGQSEAAMALGMNPRTAMWRVVLPQAMRVIVPPTGNETIAMLKDTSLLVAIPLTTELFFQLRAIGSRTYQTFPVLVSASLYYLIATSLLMLGQAWLERHFGKGYGGEPVNRPIALGSDH